MRLFTGIHYNSVGSLKMSHFPCTVQHGIKTGQCIDIHCVFENCANLFFALCLSNINRFQ